MLYSHTYRVKNAHAVTNAHAARVRLNCRERRRSAPTFFSSSSSSCRAEVVRDWISMKLLRTLHRYQQYFIYITVLIVAAGASFILQTQALAANMESSIGPLRDFVTQLKDTCQTLHTQQVRE